jgi:ketosteroid isomerase-like protein
MVSLDKAQLEALTAPQLSYGHSAGRIENQKEYVDNLMARNSVFRFINLSDQTVAVVGNDAVVRHLMTAETQNQAGQVTPVRIGVLQVWQKQGADWKLLARQAYRL